MERGIEELAYGAVVETIGVVEGPVVRGAVTEMLDSMDDSEAEGEVVKELLLEDSAVDLV